MRSLWLHHPLLTEHKEQCLGLGLLARAWTAAGPSISTGLSQSRRPNAIIIIIIIGETLRPRKPSDLDAAGQETLTTRTCFLTDL
jgi:hypothetical protein